jgi:hypothetical protein
MEAIRAEWQALEQALAALRAAIAVEYPRQLPPSGTGWSIVQYQAHRELGNWALALAEEQEAAMWAALGKELPAKAERRPEAGLSSPYRWRPSRQYLRGAEFSGR